MSECEAQEHERASDHAQIREFYFDDQSWTVRYLVADTGGWLSGQRFSFHLTRWTPLTKVARSYRST